MENIQKWNWDPTAGDPSLIDGRAGRELRKGQGKELGWEEKGRDRKGTGRDKRRKIKEEEEVWKNDRRKRGREERSDVFRIERWQP